MLSTDTLRKLLAIADVQRDPYAVTDASSSLLAANAEDGAAVLHYFRALTTLGLSAAAKRLTHPVLASQVPAIGSLTDAPSTSGQIPWTSRARRFQANLTALESRFPAAVSLIKTAAAELPNYELHASLDGNLHVRTVAEPLIHNGWLQGLSNHRAIESVWNFDRSQTPVPAPIAFDGAGYGWLMQRIADTTAFSFLTYSCALYLLEPDPLALAMLFHLHDFQPLLRSPRFRLFLGASPDQVLADFHSALQENPDWSPPQRYITDVLRPRAPLHLQAHCERIHAEREAQMKARKSAIDVYYARIPHAAWRERFSQALTGKSRLKVLGITTRYSSVLQHSMRELQTAITAAGHDFLLAIESDDQSLENPFQRLIDQHHPDLILQISRLRHENPRIPKAIPYLSWDQDNLPCMRTPEARASLDALTYVAGHAAFHGFVYLGWPRPNCIFCHLASATHRYTPRPLSSADLAKFGCDFSYVSNASGTPESLRHSLAARFAEHNSLDAFITLTDIILADPQGWTSSRAYTLVIEFEHDRHITFPAQARDEIVMNALTVADRAFRHAILSWVAEYVDSHSLKLRLFGQGWETHPRFSPYAAGSAQQGDELSAIYQASRINLQIIETGFLHSRALDGLAAGGFFLTHRTAYDGTPKGVSARLHLAHLARNGKLDSLRMLEQSTDEVTINAWCLVREQLHRDANGNISRPEEFLRGLIAFPDLPAASSLPHFADIAFSDRPSFAAMADRFLKDEPLRQEIAAALRQAVVEKFSFDTRWKQFLAGIAAGLAGS